MIFSSCLHMLYNYTCTPHPHALGYGDQAPVKWLMIGSTCLTRLGVCMLCKPVKINIPSLLQWALDITILSSYSQMLLICNFIADDPHKISSPH